jgi:hypothetical protein
MKIARLVFVAVFLSGCVQHIVLPARSMRTSEIPEVWKKVKLEKVSGTEKTTIEASSYLYYHLDEPPTRVLEKIINSRLGTDGERDYSLVVENLNYAISLKMNAGLEPEGSLGIRADFVLKHGENTKRISLEHSVNVPAGVRITREARETLYTRALIDLTDQLFFNKDALAFLGTQPVAYKDSALLEKVDVGPVLSLEPSKQDRVATGRILWDSMELETDGQAIILLGDYKGAFGAFYTRQSWRNFGLRAQLGIGYLSVEDAMSGGTSGAFSFLGNFGIELGYRGTMYTPAGYVDYPGFTFLVVPQLSFMDIIMSDVTVGIFMYGANLETEIPLGRHFGATGGIFLGSGAAAVTASTPYGTFSSSIDLGTIWYPFGDLFIQTSTGRISLGLAFQQLASGEGASDIFKNPYITLSYKAWAGRGVAYSKSKIGYKDWTLKREEEVQSTPYNVFTESSSKPAEY